MIGIIVNVMAVVIGGILGTMLGKNLSTRFTTELNKVFGVCAMGMGISSIPLMENMPAVILALVVGTALGLACHLGERISRGGELMERPISKLLGEKSDEDGMLLLNLHFSPNFVWSAGNDYLSNGYLGAFFERGKETSAKLDRHNARFSDVTAMLGGIRAEFSNGGYGYEVMVKAKLLQLLVLLRREFFPTAENGDGKNSAYALHAGGIERAIDFMDKNFAGAVTLEEIAREAYMPRTYFCAVFKKLNGMTPWQYINIRRIDEALALLKHSDDTVLKIAVRCGFNNTANFNRIFKKITGLTPAEYRKSLQK